MHHCPVCCDTIAACKCTTVPYAAMPSQPVNTCTSCTFSSVTNGGATSCHAALPFSFILSPLFHAALRFFHAAPPLRKPRPPTPKQLKPPSANRPYCPGASSATWFSSTDTKSPAFTYNTSSGEKGYRIRGESPNRYSIHLEWQPINGECLLNLIELPFNSCNCYKGIVIGIC